MTATLKAIALYMRPLAARKVLGASRTPKEAEPQPVVAKGEKANGVQRPGNAKYGWVLLFAEACADHDNEGEASNQRDKRQVKQTPVLDPMFGDIGH
jgi:hypothetical protein